MSPSPQSWDSRHSQLFVRMLDSQVSSSCMHSRQCTHRAIFPARYIHFKDTLRTRTPFCAQSWAVSQSSHATGPGRLPCLIAGLGFGGGKICRDNLTLELKDRDRNALYKGLLWRNSLRTLSAVIATSVSVLGSDQRLRNEPSLQLELN